MADVKNLAEPGKMTVNSSLKVFYTAAMFFGLIAFVVTLYLDSKRAWHAFLVGFFYFTTIGMGGFFFTAIQHATKAGWSVNVRRLCESFTAFLPVAFVLGIALLFGSHNLYEWTHAEEVAKDALLQHKAGYLNQTFFMIRFVGFFLLWIFIAKKMVKNSVEQDASGSQELTVKNTGLSILALVVFALSFSLFSVDVLMSLAPHWFSTIFGVYTFSGLFQSTMASMILLILYMQGNGQLKGYVTSDHLHDLGKFLFGFTVFWAYIAFSQYMLIWYANLPEETVFFMPRSSGSWALVSLGLLLFKFIVPFFALLPRWAKRTPKHLGAVSILILIMQFVDIYWLVYPSLDENNVIFGIQEVVIFLGFAGAFVFMVTRFLSQHSIVPIKDPRIKESLHHHVVY